MQPKVMNWSQSTKQPSSNKNGASKKIVINVERGYDLSVKERIQQAPEQADELIREERSQPEEEQANGHDKERPQSEEKQAGDISWNIPNIAMRQIERNCWEVVLTEEEKELINEFLET